MKKEIFDHIREIAIQNDGIRNRFKLASAIVMNGDIVATGVNSYKTHPMMAKYSSDGASVFLHAEIDAIKNALNKISTKEMEKCDLYVIRVKRPDPIQKIWINGMAKPCMGCMRAIVSFNLRNVYYTTTNGLIDRLS
jgi:tRNA(Arg) A34 adenosine deaminase TadA